MILSLIVAGLILGRWWRSTLPAAAVAWPLLLVASGAMGWQFGLLAASGLAVLNALVGVLLHQTIAWTIRRVHRHG